MPRRNAQRQILPAPRDDGASTASPELAEATCPLYALPNSAFAHVPPQDIKYLDYFIRQFRERLSLSRLGDSALSNFWSVTILQQGVQDAYVLDSLLAIGALAWARASVPKRIPLVHRLSGALQNEHYRKALQHYSKAVARTRQRLSDGPDDTKILVVIISCMLFFMFEHIQENTSAVDHIGAVGLDALPRLQVSAAAPSGSALKSGTEAAHFILNSNVIFHTFSPMNPQMRPRVMNIATESVLQPPAVLSPERSLEDFTAVWWRLVTTMLNLSPLCSFSSVRGKGRQRGRATAALDADSIRLLRAIATMARRLMRSVNQKGQALKQPFERSGVGTFFSTTPIDYSAILEFYRVSKMPRPGAAVARSHSGASSGFEHSAAQDAALPALLFVGRWCPDHATRLEALDICRSLLRPASSFELKSTYMVMRALVTLEGRGKEPMNRYAWTEGSWNDDYTALNVTLTPVSKQRGHVIGKKRLVLSVQDYRI
ncbi:uncharacterized protein PG998_008476 [Apiospora kogelbergensis]|uniref:uncharacterized protein n=1 Tax=Apiospora kogelbergensis TaxID=1337665 RepID=UPI0031301B50